MAGDDKDDRDCATDAEYASPPCFMHELDPAYLGYLAADDIIASLNELLEAERAGARGVGRMAQEAADTELASELAAVAHDEATFCAMLSGHVRRLGGTPSPATGAFYDKLMARSGERERLDLLDRGQSWVVAKLKAMLPRLADDELLRDLRHMCIVHEENIRRCAGLADRIRPNA